MSIAQKSFLLLRRDVVVYAIRLVSSVVIARKLGPETMGLWLILSLIPTMAEMVGRLKLDIASVYFLGQKRCKLGEMAFLLMIMALVSSGIFILFFFTFKPLMNSWLLKNTQVDDLLVYLVLASIPLHFLVMNYSYLIISKEDIVKYNRLAVIPVVLSNGLIITLLLTMNVGLKALIICTLIGQTAALFYAFYTVHKSDPLIFKFNLGLLKDMLRYSMKLYVNSFLNYFNLYISSVIVAAVLPSAHMAFFQMGKERVKLINKVPDMIGTILYPVLSNRDDKTQREALVVKSLRVSLIITTIVGAGFFVIIKPAVYLLYGAEYLPLVIVFWLLIPAMIFNGSTGCISQYFMAIGKPQILVLTSVVTLIIQVGLLYWLIKYYGYIGAAIATSSAFILSSIFRMAIFVRNSTSSRWLNFIPTKQDFALIWAFVIEKLKAVNFTNAKYCKNQE